MNPYSLEKNQGRSRSVGQVAPTTRSARRNSSVGKPGTLNPSKNRVSEKARFWYVSNEPESKVANSAVNVRTGFFMNESINTIMVFHNLIIVSPNDES